MRQAKHNACQTPRVAGGHNACSRRAGGDQPGRGTGVFFPLEPCAVHRGTIHPQAHYGFRSEQVKEVRKLAPKRVTIASVAALLAQARFGSSNLECGGSRLEYAVFRGRAI